MPSVPSGKYWYVLFVRGRAEESVAVTIGEKFKNDGLAPFLPRKAKWFVGGGKEVIEKELLFPGYVFIETALPSGAFTGLAGSHIKASSDIIRLLGYSDKEIALRECERAAWDNLLGTDKCIEFSEGIIEGGSVRVEHGPLKGCEGIIRKLNRHKREAVIEMFFMGRTMRIAVALQIIKKI